MTLSRAWVEGVRARNREFLGLAGGPGELGPRHGGGLGRLLPESTGGRAALGAAAVAGVLLLRAPRPRRRRWAKVGAVAGVALWLASYLRGGWGLGEGGGGGGSGGGTGAGVGKALSRAAGSKQAAGSKPAPASGAASKSVEQAAQDAVSWVASAAAAAASPPTEAGVFHLLTDGAVSDSDGRSFPLSDLERRVRLIPAAWKATHRVVVYVHQGVSQGFVSQVEAVLQPLARHRFEVA